MRFAGFGRLWLVAAVSMAASACHLPLIHLDAEVSCGEEVGSAHQGIACLHNMMALARDLDRLEQHIDGFGSIVGKQPDVWGQARLTKHREEFEKEMFKEMESFQDSIQASISRSDQAFFANATALSAAISGSASGVTPPQPVTVTNTNQASAPTTQPEKLETPEAKIEPDVFKAFESMSRTGVRSGTLGFGAAAKRGVAIEPTLLLDQKSRYLQYLNEIRRINEGDDTADAPGYSLNLIRIPVSVLPGKRTDKGYGAEITFTMTPHLGEELLPVTFRNLVINDLVDQIALPLTQFLNNDRDRAAEYFAVDIYAEPKKILEQAQIVRQKAAGRYPRVRQAMAPLEDKDNVDAANKFAEQRQQSLPRDLESYGAKVAIPSPRSRRSRLPFPVSQVFEIYGTEFVYRISYDAYQSLNRDLSDRGYVHVTDVQAYLREEITSSYRLLMHQANVELWEVSDAELVRAVRTRDENAIRRVRQKFQDQLKKLSQENAHKTSTAALGWAILVEAALLNDRLVQDMRETASNSRGEFPRHWLPYHRPDPPAEARQAFTEYVRARWPIHVFALDPVTQEQNLADAYSARREMQLALSLAFVSGNVSGRNMTRYARRLEIDIDTIALNRTAVGFSHGAENFGWRFYPRFQTPDIESNATVFLRDLMIGGPNRNALLRQHRLEPGIRECVAVVLMPSFVPYVTLDTTANWFRLTNPRHKVLDHTQALRLSRAVKSIQTASPLIKDAGRYRDGDLERLVRRAEQLSARLPLQSMHVQVPYENSLGGFAMFNSGITDLAPELVGWYGEPGIRSDRDTTLFLFGDHFNVHQTRVTAGGLPVEIAEMLSRQVIKVVIPKGVIPIRDTNTVDVHLATPYGISSHLEIPYIRVQPPASGPEVRWETPALAVSFVYTATGIGKSATAQNPTARLQVIPPSGFAGEKANLVLHLPAPFDAIPIKLKALPVVKDRIEISEEKMDQLIDGLFDRVGRHFGPKESNPPVELLLRQTLVEFLDKDEKPLQVVSETANVLNIKWNKVAR